tara:strand:+ start:333 stop:521 length:189 start_codon:yes stop_codon:yes gene_type:complete
MKTIKISSILAQSSDKEICRTCSNSFYYSTLTDLKIFTMSVWLPIWNQNNKELRKQKKNEIH